MGAVALAVASLYWWIHLQFGVGAHLSDKQQRAIKMSLILFPLLVSISFWIGVVVYCLSGGNCFPLGEYFWST